MSSNRSAARKAAKKAVNVYSTQGIPAQGLLPRGNATSTIEQRPSQVVPAGTTSEPADGEDPNDTEDLEIESDVSQQTLRATPLRCLQFLQAVGTTAAIRGALAVRGYGSEEHQEGWDLLHNVTGYNSVPSPEEDRTVRDAIRTLDEWDEDGFRIIAATLHRRFPEQEAFVFEGLSASKGPAAVLGVRRLLDRLDALESAPDRVASRATDQAAIAVLARRGIDSKERTRLRALVATAESAPEFSLSNAQALARAQAEQQRGLVALREWYAEWAGIARVAVKRRDHLIYMGLARRRLRADEENTPLPNPPGAPTPPSPNTPANPPTTSGPAAPPASPPVTVPPAGPSTNAPAPAGTASPPKT